MYMNIGRGCVIAGMLMILHAGLGSAHHRANLRLSEQPYDGNATVFMLIFSHMISCFVVCGDGLGPSKSHSSTQSM